MNKKMGDALNNQINAETFSSYLYLAMAAYFDNMDLPGFAKWMKAQVQEELFHVIKFYDYIYERGGTVTLTALDAPRTDWDSPINAFNTVLDHEKKVTGLINNLISIAREEKDYATENFLQWYVAEQVEEEATVSGIIKKLRYVGDNGMGLLMMDKELGQRIFTMPSTAGD